MSVFSPSGEKLQNALLALVRDMQSQYPRGVAVDTNILVADKNIPLSKFVNTTPHCVKIPVPQFCIIYLFYTKHMET